MSSDVIFVGRAIRTDRNWFDRHWVTTTFDVEEVLKGSEGGRIRVEHNDNVCDVAFQPGARIMVFANARGWWALSTSACAMATQFSEADYRAVLAP